MALVNNIKWFQKERSGKQEMVQACIQVLDRSSGNYEDLGINVIIDITSACGFWGLITAMKKGYKWKLVTSLLPTWKINKFGLSL